VAFVARESAKSVSRFWNKAEDEVHVLMHSYDTEKESISSLLEIAPRVASQGIRTLARWIGDINGATLVFDSILALMSCLQTIRNAILPNDSMVCNVCEKRMDSHRDKYFQEVIASSSSFDLLVDPRYPRRQDALTIPNAIGEISD